VSELLFLVQGEKSFDELTKAGFEIQYIVGTSEFFELRPFLLNKYTGVYLSTEKELSSLGSFSSNNAVIAVVKQKKNAEIIPKPDEFILVLDDIRDPGNLGTILRTADWFGIRTIIASETTADLYNPKVINASMGSFTRVTVYYTSLSDYFTKHPMPLYVSDLEGQNLHSTDQFAPGAIVLGNESKGVGDWWKALPAHKIRIPGGSSTESLNVGVSCGILLDRIIH